MRVFGTIWLAVAVLLLLTWLFLFAALLTDAPDVGAIFMAILMLGAAGLTFFFGVLPSVSLASRRGVWVFGRGVIPWRSISEIRVTGVPFTWLDGYAVEIVIPGRAVTLFSTATYFAWGARRKQRALEAMWGKRCAEPLAWKDLVFRVGTCHGPTYHGCYVLISPLVDWRRRPGGFLIEFSGDSWAPPDPPGYDFAVDEEDQLNSVLNDLDVWWIDDPSEEQRIMNVYFPGRTRG
ncbi:MAG: hypothetical protein QM582_08255 [Micropruina sp.]|uniref:hypothetical protein n=1 Tax=Micropruina sp. TaxID=2737536 RepID=UPI0039E4D809